MRARSLIVDRLWSLYACPERGLPMRKMTIEKLLILASYGGRLDLLRYLTGARKTCPA